MSVASPPQPVSVPAPPSPVEYVRALSPEDKEAVFVELIREAIRVNGGRCLIPVATPDGENLGYYVPPEAAAEIYHLRGPKLSPEQEAEIDRRLDRLDDAIPVDQVIAELRQQAAVLRPPAP